MLQASLPLFASEQVAALEWSFDALYRVDQLPDWFDALLRTYSDAHQLIGHGVFFSLFSGRWTPDQQAWLDRLSTLVTRYHFSHITEHFGFMTGADFHTGAPLSVPLTPSTLAIGQDRLKRIQDTARCPVGLENLAFAYSPDDVRQQGDFLARLLEPVNGFLILDLHNLFCQCQNFGVAFDKLVESYPLERVREIHLSGGSWATTQSTPERPVRRDTHDDAVPPELFAWLDDVLDRCPNVKYVVMEQLGSGLVTADARQGFAEDFQRIVAVVTRKNQQRLTNTPLSAFLPAAFNGTAEAPLEDLGLFNQQRQLAFILETATDHQHAQALLTYSSLADSEWKVESWHPAQLETAMAIAQKWRNGFD
ncbi:hypothetical protein GCM10027347_42140 [Larkinella harenae]